MARLDPKLKARRRSPATGLHALVRTRPAYAILAAIAGALTIAAACSGSSRQSEIPSASLAQSEESQQAFQGIRQRWTLATPRERLALEPSLQEFRARFPTDPLTRVANVYLAWIALERGDLETASHLADNVRKGAAGTTRDLATLITAAVLCRQGKPEPALDLLIPLVGKLLDPFAQEMMHAQLIDATIQSRRWFEALAYMDDWLRSAEPHDRGAIRDRLAVMMAGLPPDALELALRTMRGTRQRGGWSEDTRSLVAEQLSKVALGRSDPNLARTVIETPGAMETLGDAGDSLAQLASSGGLAPRILDSTIGIVLPARNDLLRARAADVVSGALEVFGPGGSTTDADGGSGIAPSESPALITRDHRDIAAPSRAPFDELAHEGAALIVAGFDADGALLASRFAESESVPVILLHAPAEPLINAKYTFVFGESEDAISTVLTEAASRGGRKGARIGGPPAGDHDHVASCEAKAVRAGELRFPLADWHKQGVGTIALAGPAHCARDAFLELHTIRWAPSLVVGLEALGFEVPKSYAGTVSIARAGLMGSGRRDPAMDVWVRAHGDMPSWWAALGRDASVLARAALAVLPRGAATDAAEVARRRNAVQRALETATAGLWTTSAAGFAGGRKIERVVEVP